MNALGAMDLAAEAFLTRLRREPGVVIRRLAPQLEPRRGPRPAGLRWTNTLFASSRFRRLHVETFRVPGRLSVLHVCGFPHLDDPAPIFGFDMIAGPARVTGIFLDLSPVTDAPARPALRDLAAPSDWDAMGQRRSLPEWGTIFSSDILAVRPDTPAEVDRAIVLAHRALEHWLDVLPSPEPATRAAVAEGQARYVAGQRRNDHTWRMLAGFVGAEAARRFMDEMLFPEIPDDSVTDKLAA